MARAMSSLPVPGRLTSRKRQKTGDGIGFFRSHILARGSEHHVRDSHGVEQASERAAHSRIIINDEDYPVNRHRNFLCSCRAASINRDFAHTVPPSVRVSKVSSLGLLNPRRATAPSKFRERKLFSCLGPDHDSGTCLALGATLRDACSNIPNRPNLHIPPPADTRNYSSLPPKGNSKCILFARSMLQ
jgi:hypothetical protein